jgi:hypothetical protein
MVGESLSALEPRAVARLRIFGKALTQALPTALHSALAPYDERLDVVLPGTRADFSQRALLHFVRSVVMKYDEQDRDGDHAAVEAALGGVMPPDMPRRARRSDEEILQLISERLRSQLGIARILRALRDEDCRASLRTGTAASSSLLDNSKRILRSHWYWNHDLIVEPLKPLVIFHAHPFLRQQPEFAFGGRMSCS